MILEIENKKISLVFRTRSIVKATQILKGKNFEDVYFNALSENNIEALSQIILVFGEDTDTGITAFKNVDEVYEFLDEYMEQNKKSYQDIFKEVAKDINEMGFFNQKMTQEELEKKMATHMSIDMDEIIKTSAEKAVSKIAEQEFRGYKG